MTQQSLPHKHGFALVAESRPNFPDIPDDEADDVGDPVEIHRVVNQTREAQLRFNAISAHLEGLPQEIVINIMLTMFVESICQKHGNLTGATAMFEEAMYKARSYMQSHYNPIGGRKVVEEFSPIIRRRVN